MRSIIAALMRRMTLMRFAAVFVLLPASWYGAFIAGEDLAREQEHTRLEYFYNGLEDLVHDVVRSFRQAEADRNGSGSGPPPTCAAPAAPGST